jgi:hypothetical protein
MYCRSSTKATSVRSVGFLSFLHPTVTFLESSFSQAYAVLSGTLWQSHVPMIISSLRSGLWKCNKGLFVAVLDDAVRAASSREVVTREAMVEARAECLTLKLTLSLSLASLAIGGLHIADGRLDSSGSAWTASEAVALACCFPIGFWLQQCFDHPHGSSVLSRMVLLLVPFLTLELALYWVKKPQSSSINNLQALMMLIVDWQIQ